jgi:hypothetical protein|tara:strand:- start:452 stop:652 length:201 start_codon:yes stop_codon:yes gene_type:complete
MTYQNSAQMLRKYSDIIKEMQLAQEQAVVESDEDDESKEEVDEAKEDKKEEVDEAKEEDTDDDDKE